jgi:hypothetical protein
MSKADFGVDVHSTQLHDGKRPAAKSDTFLQKERVPLRLQPNGQRGNEKDRQGKQQKDAAQHEINRPFHQSVGAFKLFDRVACFVTHDKSSF